MITWKFNELPITFKSTEAKLSRDILRMAHANHIDPSSLITIIDGDTNHIISGDAPGSHGDTSTATQSAIWVDIEELICPEPEAHELPSVFSDMDDADPDLDLLG
jgi:hypothetical protein